MITLNHNLNTLLLVGLLVGCLSGCQTLDVSQPADWLMKGRVIVRTSEQAERLNISWRQFGPETEILLTGPLGASVARIYPAGGGYVLERPKSRAISANSPEQLLDLAIGTPIPVSAALAILNGEVARTQAGPWHIAADELDELGRPVKVKIDGPDVAIQLVVQSWQ